MFHIFFDSFHFISNWHYECSWLA